MLFFHLYTIFYRSKKKKKIDYQDKEIHLQLQNQSIIITMEVQRISVTLLVVERWFWEEKNKRMDKSCSY